MRKLFIMLFFALSSPKLVAICIGLGCSCRIDTVSPVAFGDYNPIVSTPHDRSGEFSVTCSALGVGLNVSYTMALSTGLYGTFAARKMEYAGKLLSYNLYTTSGYTSVWGDGSFGTATVSEQYNLAVLFHTATYTVFGRIPASQIVGVGSYDDTVTISLTF